jgi:hypothetical protein
MLIIPKREEKDLKEKKERKRAAELMLAAY